MVHVVIGILSWSGGNPIKKRDDFCDNVVTDSVARQNYNPPVINKYDINGRPGCYVRVEYADLEDPGPLWTQAKAYLTATRPADDSRVRLLECDWDGADTGCVPVEQILWVNGQILTFA